ncbi:hypothetical protein AVEN_143798-1 [Araneus ventricosus]|uniref:Uncharacterized protein n=1 Tax=Araneus ventricosus TaxID=182803 RepID=A0A4Y2K739_ARAVE|nr:hypothetical protein AVEN_143798-1 [Araneus ventricosus]
MHCITLDLQVSCSQLKTESQLENIVKQLKEHSISKLNYVEKTIPTIILEDNHIPEVGNDWFTTGPAGLTTLIFERNGIEELGDRAFASLSNLRLLVVAGNHLTEISRSVIPRPAAQLRTLDLAYNKLRTLPSDLFADMPSLREVNLDYNLIHVLKEDTFSSALSRLTALSLEGNPLECDERLQWVCRSRSNVISGKCILSATSNGRTVRQFCGV